MDPFSEKVKIGRGGRERSWRGPLVYSDTSRGSERLRREEVSRVRRMKRRPPQRRSGRYESRVLARSLGRY